MEQTISNSEITKSENLVYKKSELLTDSIMSYCPGCGHGTATRMLAEAIQELGIAEETIGVSSVGCSNFIYNYIDIDFVAAPHGRAAAVATGVKRVWPNKFVFTYQGDGDLAAIGSGESLHTCNRGENLLLIMVNNGVYGMTGGQMAPTTLEGMKTSTSPYGRDLKSMGNPIQFAELAAQLPGTYYVTRQTIHTPAAVRKTKNAFKKALEYQKLGKGLCYIEIVSSCNSGWKMTPVEANKWMEEHMFAYYPLGDLKIDGELIKK